MPWENHRAVRLLNLLMYWALQRNDWVSSKFKFQTNAAPGEVSGVVDLLAYPSYPTQAEWQGITRDRHHRSEKDEIIDLSYSAGEWMRTTLPDLRWVDEMSTHSVHAMSEFEARRRGTILVLAIEAYRLKHGKLPNTLQYSVGIELKQVPVDPYSGYEFRYFPDGIPQEIIDEIRSSALSTIPPIVQSGLPAIGSSAEQQQAIDSAESQPQVSPYDHRYRQAGIWCTGPDLKAESHSGYYFNSRLRVKEYDYSTRSDRPSDTEQWQPTDVWWPNGFLVPDPGGAGTMNTTQTDQAIAAPGNPTVRLAQQAPSQLAGSRHLLWKEYRSIRLFWISMLAPDGGDSVVVAPVLAGQKRNGVDDFSFRLGRAGVFCGGGGRGGVCGGERRRDV